MIKISDHYSLMPELFDLWPDDLIKGHGTDVDLDILPTWDADAPASQKPTIIVCTEPNSHHAHIVFADLLGRRPNSYWAINHIVPDQPWQVPNQIFWPSNMIMTVRANDLTRTWATGTKDYQASALLGGWTTPRSYLFFWLTKAGLLERCLVNFRLRPDQQKNHFKDYQSPEIPDLDDPRFQQRAYLQGGINTMTPIEFEKHQQNWISQIIPWNIYDRCWINLVAETDTKGFLPSEKITKPIMAAQPWVVFAGHHYLKHLREMGFQSFDRWIDESYDNMPNDNLRAQAVVASLDRFSQLPDQEKITQIEEMKPILEHNRKMLLDLRHWYQPVFDAIIKSMDKTKS